MFYVYYVFGFDTKKKVPNAAIAVETKQ